MSKSIGGIILALQALSSLTGGMLSVVGFLVAREQVAPLFQAATRSKNGQPLAMFNRKGGTQKLPRPNKFRTVEPTISPMLKASTT